MSPRVWPGVLWGPRRASGAAGGRGVLTGPRDHTVLVRQGALHQRLTVLVAAAHMAVQGPGWGEEAQAHQSGLGSRPGLRLG